MKFKVGDLVRLKTAPVFELSFPLNRGEVVKISKYDEEVIIKVSWFHHNNTVSHFSYELEFAETPIQRMRRRYSEV